MIAICGATVAITAKTGPSPFSGDYSAAHGVAVGVTMTCLSGEGPMPDIAVRGAANGRLVKGGNGGGRQIIRPDDLGPARVIRFLRGQNQDTFSKH